jgi:glyoxylase-like metal-dependent hydrolase (beta-lactamase superfamily II)
MEVAPGIHRIDLEYTGGRLAIYAALGERTTLIDAGYAGASGQIDAYLRRVGRSLAGVDLCVITHAHADHMGGAAEVAAAAPRLSICAHAADVAWIEDVDRHIREAYHWPEPFGMPLPAPVIARLQGMLGRSVKVGTILYDGDTVDMGGWRLQVAHVPGHTRGHIALVDARSGSVLAGDATHEPGPPPAYFDAGIYLETQRRLVALEPARLLGCHYPVKEGAEARAFLAAAAAHVEACHRVVRDALANANGPVRLADVADALLRRFRTGEISQRWVHAAYGHLLALERTGEATRRDWQALPAWGLRR